MSPIFHTRLVGQQTIAERQSEYARAQRSAKGRVRNALVVFGLAIFSYFIGSGAVANAAASDTLLVNEPPVQGTYADAESYEPKSSASGRFVAFSSRATNLHDADGFTANDVFVRDLREDSIQLVSRASGIDGAGGDSDSNNPSISASGRYVAFASESEDFSDQDAPGVDVFVRDLKMGKTVLVSRASGRTGAGADGISFAPSISADGRYVAFTSEAQNLDGAAADTRNVFVRDLKRKQTYLVSRKSNFGKGGDSSSDQASISADGMRIAFRSLADNLSRIDNSGLEDVFVHDMRSGKTSLVSRKSGGKGGNSDSLTPAISANGEHVAFSSYASNLTPADSETKYDIFVHGLRTGRTTVVSKNNAGVVANEDAETPSISGGGRFVAYQSFATNLSGDDPDLYNDVFVFDRERKRVSLATLAGDGGPADGASFNPSLSADGRYVAFESRADNLSDMDAQTFTDVFRTPVQHGPAA